MATRHTTDDDLELYALDRLADSAPVEEHLLVCEECRERLVGWDDYVRAMRAAMQQTAQSKGRVDADAGPQCDCTHGARNHLE